MLHTNPTPIIAIFIIIGNTDYNNDTKIVTIFNGKSEYPRVHKH